jgi:3-oxoacyl-[acyl-carrier protein] reductase
VTDPPVVTRDLAARTALITGSTGGLAKTIATELAHRGAHVVINGRHKHTVDATVAELEAAGLSASAAVGDICDPSQAIDVVDEAALGRQLDFCVLSGAGTSGAGLLFKLFKDMDVADFPGVATAHWLSKAYLTHAAVRHMAPNGYGKIVALSTDAGRVGTTNESMIGGGAAALMQMFRVLARELGPDGIRLNVVSCGPVTDTVSDLPPLADADSEAGHRVASRLLRRRMFPVSGVDLANTVGFLLAETGDNITGQTWSVNGGISMVG